MRYCLSLVLVVTLLLVCAAVPTAKADLYVAFYEDFSDITDWTCESGSGLLTAVGGKALLESDAGSNLAYRATVSPPAYSTTYNMLTVVIVNLTTNLYVFVTGSRSTMAMNVSTAGRHVVDVGTLSNHDLISGIYIEVVDGAAVLDELSLARSSLPNFLEQFEFLFNVFSAQEVWVLPSILIIGTLVVLAVIFVPPREKRHGRSHIRGV